jgi:hypothetical protein
MYQSRHRTYLLLTGTLLTGMLVAFFLAVLSGGAKARAEGTGDQVLVAAGDIADCTSPNDEATANLLGTMPADAKVATLGDGAYPKGSASDYLNCYDPSWGLYKAQTMPATGNHDYNTAGASGYFGYFRDAASPTQPGCTASCKGYYSYELGSWHVVVLNSNCTKVGGCTATSPQVQWLKSDLAANTRACTLAYWHEPRFSSVQTGTRLGAFWNVLYKKGAEVVLNGHQHNYERFAPQSPSGAPDTAKGIREFVVGTGGETLHPFNPPPYMANSEVRDASTFGVLKLTLHTNSYDWQFVPVAGQSFTDSSTAPTSCH